ncbi:MAG: sigma-54-dependent transcriptional regulator [Desulfatibacillaceae bacterium]
MARILIVDDDQMICDTLTAAVRGQDMEADYALNLEDGMAKAMNGEFDVVFLDVRLPDGNGLEVIPDIRSSENSPEVIIITGEGDPDGAELAIVNGAWDYVQKPFTLQAIVLSLSRALQYHEEKAAQKASVALKREGIIGSSPRMRQCYDLLAQAANTQANVLITGETGTGKELFARAIHENSRRADKSFVVVDCAALPETLVESVLFGHVKGAFTGADMPRDGLAKQADDGTLFLDEVGELPVNMQKSFLRVLQERTFRPVGGKSEVKSDFRLIAATNRDLDSMVREGRFRDDLMFRLRALTMDLPPLRERPEDILDLATHHMNRLCERYGIITKGFSPEFRSALLRYAWPGNVRELFNAVERALSSAPSEPTLYQMHLPVEIRVQLTKAGLEADKQEARPAGGRAAERPRNSFPHLKDFLEETEKRYLQDLMAHTGENIKEVCRISGLSRSRLYDRLKKYSIQRRQ